nr:hypothetical protein [Bacteroidota bacterium]
MKKQIVILTLAIFGWHMMSAQWTTNPGENTRFTDLSGEQVIPKIAVCSDGYAYVSWFSSESGNYNVRLQRIDQDGNPQWEANGILVSDNPSMSWLTDWDLAVDPEDFALVTFQDIRTGDNNIFGYRISPEGESVWGE